MVPIEVSRTTTGFFGRFSAGLAWVAAALEPASFAGGAGACEAAWAVGCPGAPLTGTAFAGVVGAGALVGLPPPRVIAWVSSSEPQPAARTRSRLARTANAPARRCVDIGVIPPFIYS